MLPQGYRSDMTAGGDEVSVRVCVDRARGHAFGSGTGMPFKTTECSFP